MSSDALQDFELAVHFILGRIKEQTLNEQEKYEEELKVITTAIKQIKIGEQVTVDEDSAHDSDEAGAVGAPAKFACKRVGSTVYHRVAVMDLCAGYQKMSEANKNTMLRRNTFPSDFTLCRYCEKL
eukprot:2242853-Rhodomonas_salina.2